MACSLRPIVILQENNFRYLRGKKTASVCLYSVSNNQYHGKTFNIPRRIQGHIQSDLCLANRQPSSRCLLCSGHHLRHSNPSCTILGYCLLYMTQYGTGWLILRKITVFIFSNEEGCHCVENKMRNEIYMTYLLIRIGRTLCRKSGLHHGFFPDVCSQTFNVMGNWERINMPDTIFNEHLSLFINSMFVTEKIVVRRSTFSTIDPTGVSSNLYYHFCRFRLCMVALVAQISACSQDIEK